LWFDYLQIASVPSKRANKLCTHGHHSDRSVAAAIFVNGTYFVDTPRIPFMLVSGLPYSSSWKMEAIGSFETPVDF
jgi:hypothetical protein